MPADADHSDIVKFDNHTSITYKRVKYSLEQMMMRIHRRMAQKSSDFQASELQSGITASNSQKVDVAPKRLQSEQIDLNCQF